jgi:nitrogen fixation protein NifU and related proteins
MDDLRELYQEIILDHGKRPRNHRHPADCNRSAKGDNPLCGDRITVYLTLDDRGWVQDAAFEGRGCAISTASASMMTEIVKGKNEADVHALFQRFHAMCTGESDADGKLAKLDPDAYERLRVLAGVRQFPMRVKCATLAWHTLEAALAGKTLASTE